jgi:ADP-ribose pyrophosphatase
MKRPIPRNYDKIPDEATEIFKGLRAKIYQWKQKRFDGSYSTYESVKKPDTVIIIPVIGEEVVMVKELQPHWVYSIINLVAGGVNEDEDLEKAARRELEEETGMIFENFYLVGVDAYVSGVDWNFYTFVAKDLKETRSKKLDPGEQNEVVMVSHQELVKMTRERKLYHRALLIENMIIEDKLDDFYDLLQHPEKYQINQS